MTKYTMTILGSLVITLVLLAVLSETGEIKEKGLSRFALEQKPLLFAGEGRNRNREVGASCRFNSHCSSGCCVQTKPGRNRRCERKVKKGELCSEDQIKGGAYVKYCPCEKGDGHCPRGKEPKCQA
uniref:U8-Theraphotoxin-Sfo1a_1 n=2 Tax=Theraphosidae TaxID=6895 RepID=A0A482ZCD2_9ARAC